jgi:hypothetical protein
MGVTLKNNSITPEDKLKLELLTTRQSTKFQSYSYKDCEKKKRLEN